ncbi:hypothetical protein WN944_006434 [Citrus x changshan-huyou]|uniref:Uncharacterized protein n=1 Tax=Citrus x changshan-huyou TaxID=2935761 RepID=A0AAP0QX72_9ROSI
MPRLSCYKLKVLPDYLLQMTTLQRLNIRGCPILEERYRREDWHKISHIPHIRWFAIRYHSPVDVEDSMENIGVTKDYHCGYCAMFGCWNLEKEVMAGSALFQLRMDSCLKDMMVTTLHSLHKFALSEYPLIFIVFLCVDQVIISKGLKEPLQLISYSWRTLASPRIRLAMELLPLLLLCKEECELHGFEEVFAVNFPPRAITAKRHIHSSNLVSDLQGVLSVTIPSVSTNALGYGAFIGLYANMRYQLLCGFDRAVTNHFEVIGVALIGQLKREETGWSGGRCLHKFVGVDVVNCPILLPVEETQHGSPHQTLRHLRNSMRWWYSPGVNFLASVVHR